MSDFPMTMPTVDIELDGDVYTLKGTVEFIINVEHKLNRSIFTLGNNITDIKLLEIATIIHCGVTANGDKAPSIADICQMIVSNQKLGDAMQTIAEIINSTLSPDPATKKKGKKPVGKKQKK